MQSYHEDVNVHIVSLSTCSFFRSFLSLSIFTVYMYVCYV